MSYVCVDRGTERCPCVLMAVGQCYTCSMMATGVCDCGSKAGWQGVCPYMEFMQNGGQESPAAPALRAGLVSRKTYADELTVVRLRVPRGFARRCRRLGSFVMARPAGYPEAGWQTPLSVLRAEDVPDVVAAGGGLSGGVGENVSATDALAVESDAAPALAALATEASATDGLLSFAVKPAGPKTQALLAGDCREWELSGPYVNGLLNSEAFADGRRSFVVAKGTAVAPLICMREDFLESGVKLYLDTDKLTDAFIRDYLGEEFIADAEAFQAVQLSDPAGLMRVKQALQQSAATGEQQNLLTLVSPYYAEKLQEAVSAQTRKRLIWPNPANMCCARGLCGACSYTDEHGVTVRRCKCNHEI